MEALFDRSIIATRKRRAAGIHLPGSDFLLERVCSDLEDRLSVVQRSFDHAVTLFCGTGRISKSLAETGKAGRVTRIEIDDAVLGGHIGLVQKDEIVPLEPHSADLVVSLLALHEINDLPGMLAQIRRTLRPDGLCIAAFAGAGTLRELRESFLAAETELNGGASARVYPFPDVRDAGALLQRSGFALPVADVEAVTARYGSMKDLMLDLRAMGATSALVSRSRKPLTRTLLERTEEQYRLRFAGMDGRLPATFNIVWISGWAPHPSQQKPLEPGSAQKGLADALAEITGNDGKS